MIAVRKSQERGHADHGWLNARHTFSFANYHDPKHMGFRALRVINEDVVQPGKGFGTHSHNDMEIVTYVLSGALEHKDSMGNKGVILPGEVQYMSAGTGVRHSEFNHSTAEPVHLMQIWLLPREQGLKPAYDQRAFSAEERRGKLRLVVSGAGNGDALKIQQDVELFASLFRKGDFAVHTLGSGRAAYVQVARGSISINGTTLEAGDGAAIENEAALNIQGESPDEAEFLLFDLA